jgi:F420H(2)-dependent quinone reductase
MSVLGRAIQAHGIVYRLTGGLVGHRFPGAPPFLLLEHIGARSGENRSSPLAYLRDGENVVVVASKGGNPRHPAWFHNLRANPDTTIRIGTQRRQVRARVATPEERSRLWPKVLELYPGYRSYQERTERQIPLVILEPSVPPT